MTNTRNYVFKYHWFFSRIVLCILNKKHVFIWLRFIVTWYIDELKQQQQKRKKKISKRRKINWGPMTCIWWFQECPYRNVHAYTCPQFHRCLTNVLAINNRFITCIQNKAVHQCKLTPDWFIHLTIYASVFSFCTTLPPRRLTFCPMILVVGENRI